MSDPVALAATLIDADADERTALLQPYRSADAAIAQALAAALKQAYDESFSHDLARAAQAAATLTALAALTPDATVQGLAAWTAGLVALDAGRLPDAVAHLDRAETIFQAAGQPEQATAVQIGKMAPLAMQGQFDAAYAAGLAARAASAAQGDLLTAGKIEQNLGNLDFMRQRYREAEARYREARDHFVQADDVRQLAQIDNCLATTLTSQHRFQEAEHFYAQAVQRAEAAQLEMTLAEIECNLGCLALYQGRFDQALDNLERSRRRYVQLDMPHELAIAEQELADAYLELNMAPEAAAIYARVTPRFAELGMPGEQARALAYHGRACVALGQPDQARPLLAEAARIYAATDMPVGAAIARLTTAQLDLQAGDYAAGSTALAAVEPVFADARAAGWLLQTRWLLGVLARLEGRLEDAQERLTATLADAQAALIAPVAQRCVTELGLVALATGDAAEAERRFREAVTQIEAMRAPLPAEEFQIGFIGDKLTPYVELVRLCLADGSPTRRAEALDFVERSRARTLVDRLGGQGETPAPRDDFEAALFAQLAQLRHELNWFYSQLGRPESGAGARSAELDLLHQAARSHETAILDLARQLQQRSDGGASAAQAFDLAQLQRDLGSDTALVEYLWLEEGALAFVVTGAALHVVELACHEAEVQAALQQFHFQLGALRHAGAHLQRHMPALIQRVQRPLATLYDLLLAPLLGCLGDRRLVVAPQRSLHYVPFHALYNGEQYLIETREVSAAPSATLLHHCLAAPAPPLRRALLLGLPDAYAPRVADEVAAIAPLFADPVTLLSEAATRTALEQHAPSADLLHLACHGRFRGDSPFFSALHLADGWMTVRDAYTLRLRCGLVTLSACETGLSALMPGDDLVGLARGFFLAGAPALVSRCGWWTTPPPPN
jgi:CHAT domain-containing protein